MEEIRMHLESCGFECETSGEQSELWVRSEADDTELNVTLIHDGRMLISTVVEGERIRLFNGEIRNVEDLRTILRCTMVAG